MEKIIIGKYVKTHGIKGEIRIRSNFKYKDRVFKVGNKIFIGEEEFQIKSHRLHQEYDMVTLENIDNINQILPLKGSLVYYLKDNLNLSKLEYLDSDLIGMEVYMKDNLKGYVQDITFINKDKKLLVINSSYVPFELIKKIDLENKRIDLEEVSGLL